ncbi:MAG TPA: bifunctional nuclease family protein [Candidatus Latescibacteria bacterium]|nr:bifunctional nuclease family protein [Candidatus Handelsmanbacteria bacterium]HIL11073.1 bifunctional nuclease family protein [Candidatus Latescibacterota bacterium]
MGEASLVEMTVVKVSPYLREDRPLVWLSEKESGQPRLLPIAIGEFEAAAIQMQLENDEPIRPISYDLLSSMLDCLTIGVRQVIIHNVRRSIYYAKVVIEKDHKIKDIDSRPSDAIAVALRTSSPIYVARELLDKVGLEPLETELDIEHTLDRFYELEPQISEALNPEAEAANISLPESQLAQTPNLSETEPPAEEEKSELTLLQHQLQQAVLCEEYEEAARLRDVIDSLEDKTSP